MNDLKNNIVKHLISKLRYITGKFTAKAQRRKENLAALRLSGENIFTCLNTKLLLVLGSWFLCLVGNAQSFPVQVHTIITPPYSVYLNDYMNPESNKLSANIVLTDMKQQQIDVKLRVTITNNIVRLHTSPLYMPAPITLYGGVMETLTAAELAPYLSPEHIIYEGRGAEDFYRTGKLPEGFYTFTIEALHYYRDIPASNKGTAMAWLVQNEPPQLVSPLNKQTVNAGEIQNIMFSWMPRHLGSPNAVSNTIYEFTLVEMPNESTDPDFAIRTIQPIFKQELDHTHLLYSSDLPQLEPGFSYAWNVKAKDIGGRDLFKNNGCSRTYKFKYGTPCHAPMRVTHRDEGTRQVTFDWTGLPGSDEYVIRLKDAENAGATWHERTSTEETYHFTRLSPGRTYQYRIKAVCKGQSSEYSNLKEFTTISIEDSEPFVCSPFEGTPDIVSNLPLQSLKAGDVFNVGGFNAKVTRAQGGNGTFTGYYEVFVPVLNTNLIGYFKGMQLNNAYQLTGGEVKMLQKNSPESIAYHEDNNEFVPDDNSTTTNDTTTNITNQITVNHIVDSVYIEKGNTDSTSHIVLVDENGDTTRYAYSDNATITDSNGNTTVIAGGQVASSGSTGTTGTNETNFELGEVLFSSEGMCPDAFNVKEIKNSYKDSKKEPDLIIAKNSILKIFPKISISGSDTIKMIKLVIGKSGNNEMDNIPETEIKAEVKVVDGYIVSKDDEGILYQLPDYVDYYEALEINYYAETGSTKWEKIGTSSNRAFVTFETPSNKRNNVDRRLLYYSCRKAKGLSSKNNIIDILWEDFSINPNKPDDTGNLCLDAFIPNSGHTQMTYYKSNTNYSSYHNLLEGKDAQCGAFARLWAGILDGQGIDNDWVEMIPDTQGETMLIYNWEEKGSKTSNNKNYPYVIVPIKYTGGYYFFNAQFLSPLTVNYLEGIDYYYDFLQFNELTKRKFNQKKELENKILKIIQKLSWENKYLTNRKQEKKLIKNILFNEIKIENLIPDIRTNNEYPNNYDYIFSDLINIPGIKGQGNKNPLKDFDIHFCVKIGNKIYDPSYGVITEGTLKNHRKKSVQFYAKPEEISIDENITGDINNDNEIEVISKLVLIIRKK